MRLVEAKIKELKRKHYCELVHLPEYQCDKATHFGILITVAIWKDVLDSHQVRIVVQGYRYYFLGIGSMDAFGFIMSDCGSIRDIKTKELYEFM